MGPEVREGARGLRLASQVQARTQQRAAENWLDLFVLVSTHGLNLAGQKRTVQAMRRKQVATFTQR
jgi:hypothetical protein